MSNEKISTGHYLYDGIAVFSDNEERGYTVWGLDENDARQEITRKATGDRNLPCWVKQVVKR